MKKRWRRRIRWLVSGGAVVAVLALGLVAAVELEFSGTWQGVYLLRDGWRWRFSDELLLGNESRFIFGVDVRRGALDVDPDGQRPRPRLVWRWSDWDGTGYVRSLLPGGREIVTTFSRWVDERGRHPLGLFLGGRPPLLHGNEGTRTLNRSGMAYYDGRRWLHLWCNANEAIGTEDGASTVQVFDWKLLESGIVEATPGAVTLRSVHRVILPRSSSEGEGKAGLLGAGDGGHPLEVRRFAVFRAGEPYVLLGIAVKNQAAGPVVFRYGYGDEPWLGEYGSSRGNVGWVAGRLVRHEESIDPVRHRYAGYYDYGNDAIGTGHDFTNVANFVEWYRETLPSEVYFSNGVGRPPARDGAPVPLAGNERALTLEWGPTTLKPGEVFYIVLAFGMAEADSSGRVPRKPSVDFGPMEGNLFGR